MSAEKKRPRIRGKFRAPKERKRRMVMSLALILPIFIALIYLNSTFLAQPLNSTFELKAAIVDQASLSPAGGINETFIKKTTNILREAGYKVDYYPGINVTIDFYRDLPTHGYTLIILRVHIATNPERRWVGFFSSEPYSKTKYANEQLNDRLVPTTYNYPPKEGDPTYFGITPSFVASSMKGRFQNTTIITTGCNGLEYPSMAEAFIKKGAKVYLGWDKAIYFSHTDAATVHLLRHLITEKQTINRAINNAMVEVGKDPLENSLLTYYPLEIGNQTV